MRLVSHAHINGNGDKFRDEYARILAKASKKRGYTHCVIGCHGRYIASRQTMKEVEKIGITPIRFAELSITVDNNPRNNSHVAFINLPESPIQGFNGDNKCHNIKELMPYVKKVGCKLVLCHPKSLAEIKVWSPYIDGYEIMNGLDRYQRNFKNRDASAYYPKLVQFCGADYHVWKGMGDMDYFTNLPDNWFGKLYK